MSTSAPAPDCWSNLPKTVEQQTLDVLLRIERLLERPQVIVQQTLCNQKNRK